jgi:hypothetical protein
LVDSNRTRWIHDQVSGHDRKISHKVAKPQGRKEEEKAKFDLLFEYRSRPCIFAFKSPHSIAADNSDMPIAVP